MYDSNEVIDQLPRHLLDLIIDQPYNSYTAQDHAVWRYVMRRNVDYLSKVAHHSYVDGLKETGVDVDSIPHMYGMNRILSKIGWAAVTVDGFIPPGAFMEFQAYNVLVIAADIRPITQIEYTPAPDIIHEAAGHAPIIADPDYAEYLRLFGEIGHRAFSSRLDHAMYEAIRHLSILKADPYSHEDAVMEAEEAIKDLESQVEPLSEMSLIRNLHWWTVEYGLIGTPEDPKIYGAGLLSSIGESKTCLSSEVRKIPYSLEAKDYSFDITTRQPQLFVTPDFNHLTTVLDQFADTMALRRGGLDGVRKAIDSGNLATCVLSSGIQVSGTFSKVYEKNGNPVYIKTDGPTQLAYSDRQIQGHGKDHHTEGFGTPVGHLVGHRQPLRKMSDGDLKSLGVAVNKKCTLEFMSGVRVEGVLRDIIRREGEIILMSFVVCTVTYEGNPLFMPGWGQYDMAIGEEVISAFAGLADADAFGMKYPVPVEKTHKIIHSDWAIRLHKLYQDVRDIRESGKISLEKLEVIWTELHHDYQNEWLLAIELLELLIKDHRKSPMAEEIISHLDLLRRVDDENERLINSALDLLSADV